MRTRPSLSVRRLGLALAALGLAALALVAVAPPAAAQPAPPAPAAQPAPAGAAPAPVAQPALARGGAQAAPAAVPARIAPHSDTVESSGKGMALLFWAFALAAVGGALFVVTRRNLIAAVMGMVGSFLGIAAVYMMLYASFLAVVQMLVYAGAIMVLFVFVVMILNRPEDEPVAPTGRLGQVLGGAALVYLVGRLVLLLVAVRPPAGALAAPRPTPIPGLTGPGSTHEWGSVRSVGTDLFGPGLFPFEAISILLLVAVVGAIAIARPLTEQVHEAGGAGPEGAAR